MAIDTKPAAFYADFGGLATLKGAAKGQDPKALREAARQFESLFTQMMLKSMRQASTAISGGDSLMDNDQSNMYREMFDNQMAVQLSKGRGLGLADVLVRQLTQSGLASGEPPVNGAKTTATNPASKVTAIKLDAEQKVPSFALGDNEKKTPFPVPESRWPFGAIAKPTVQPAVHAEKQIESNVAHDVVAIPIPLPMTPTPTLAMPDASPTDSPVIETPRPQPLAKDAADFVRQLWPHAQKAARELGVDAKTLIAHAALETGWGKFVPCNPDGTCSFNLFGIKATNRWQGPSTAVNTLEYEDGVAIKKRESFRAYESPADSFRDYASFIKSSPRYSAALGAGGDAVAFASALQQGGYATDPNYAAKLASVASRLSAFAPAPVETSIALKIADAQPLSTGRSVSAGDRT